LAGKQVIRILRQQYDTAFSHEGRPVPIAETVRRPGTDPAGAIDSDLKLLPAPLEPRRVRGKPDWTLHKHHCDSRANGIYRREERLATVLNGFILETSCTGDDSPKLVAIDVGKFPLSVQDRTAAHWYARQHSACVQRTL
jgi:hypothetical protein